MTIYVIKRQLLPYIMSMEISFLDLRCREVVNIVDGRKLGHITDIVIDLSTCQIKGIVVPGECSFWNILKPSNTLFIPFNQVVKIGEDSILVEISGTSSPINVFTLKKDK